MEAKIVQTHSIHLVYIDTQTYSFSDSTRVGPNRAHNPTPSQNTYFSALCVSSKLYGFLRTRARVLCECWGFSCMAMRTHEQRAHWCGVLITRVCVECSYRSSSNRRSSKQQQQQPPEQQCNGSSNARMMTRVDGADWRKFIYNKLYIFSNYAYMYMWRVCVWVDVFYFNYTRFNTRAHRRQTVSMFAFVLHFLDVGVQND